jgi:hypothetical protein
MALRALAQPPMPANPIEIKPNAAVSTAVTRCQSEYDAYVECFLDWCVEHGHVGDHDGDQVIALTRQFDRFARTPPVHTSPFFQALRRVGIEPRMIDLSHTDPRYAEKKARGCQRPRIRIYNLPTEMPDCFVPTADTEPLPLAA